MIVDFNSCFFCINAVTNRLPIVAKKLEECLYRMAKTKEEYMNASTLKRRLQVIAISLAPKKSDSESEKAQPLQALSVEAQQRIDLLRNRNKQLESRINAPNRPQCVTSSGGGSQTSGQASSQQLNSDPNAAIHSAALSEMLKQQHLKAYHAAIAELQPNFMHASQKQSSANAPEASSQTIQSKINSSSSSNKDTSSSSLSTKQKNKVIRQQQQRLILLRHASKCRTGPSCPIKFCAQMVKLWNHMKECRNKDCTTQHCLSSRCVLNHYKTCKDEGRTATCEVCAPVVQWIRGSKDEKCVEVDNSAASATQRMSTTPTAASHQRQSSMEAAVSSLTSELQTKQMKLEQQYRIIKHLESQQEREQRSHQQNNIDPSSEMGRKLMEQKMLLERCKKQFLNDQKVLSEVVKNHSKRLRTESGRLSMSSQTSNFTAPGRSSLTSQDNPMPGQKTTTDNSSSAQYSGIFDSSRTLGNDDDDTTRREKGSGGINDFWADFSRSNDKKSSNKRRRSEISNDDDDDGLGGLFRVDSQASFLDSLDDNPQDVFDVLKTDMPSIEVPSIGVPSIGEGTDSGTSSVSSQILPLLQKILDHQFGWLFRDPVDPVELGIPDYFDVIKEPMDLGKVKRRLESGYYTTIDNAAQDVKLVFENAIKYNGESSEVGCMAVQMLEMFVKDLNSLKSSVFD